MLLRYKGLKIDILEKAGNNFDKQEVVSLAANLLIKNNNENNKVNIDFTRDTNKSFFNLIWKSIFQGPKKTVL